jgi:DNA mismatch endonuclease (patch repair protein)
MVDHLSSSQRSRLMARVRQKNTAPELVVRRTLWRAGYRYRRHLKDLPGTPDIVFPRRRCVIFVHGCFWHRHEGCKRATLPSAHRDFWVKKFAANTIRDANVVAALENARWRVLVVWECEVKAPDLLDRLVAFLSD